MGIGALDDGQVDLIKRWFNNPLRFFADVWPDEKLSRQQETALKDMGLLVRCKIKSHNKEKMTKDEAEMAKKVGISIMSGQGPGKDALAAISIIWFLCCFPYPKIPCTAPTGHQLKDVLWAEINKWIRRSRKDDSGQPMLDVWLQWQSDKVFWKDAGGKEWFAVARTTNTKATADEQAETLAGFHEDFLMIVVDEASGLPEPVFKPLEGTLSGKCNFSLLLFNPTRNQGFALESQRRDREHWVCHHWDAEESEIVSKEHVEAMAKKYGRDSNAFRIRVKGLPPLESSDTLIQWEWAMEAIDRDIEPLDNDPLIFGLDIGGGGDPSVLLRYRGACVEGIETLETTDSEALTGWVMRRIFDYEPEYVFVDSGGIGWGIVGNLVHRCPGFKIIGINAGEAAYEKDRFVKIRDELWWRLREKFERGIISIPNDPILIGELTTIKYDDKKNLGKIKVEAKSDMKKRGIDSPDRADALCLCQYYEADVIRRMRSGQRSNWRASQRSDNWKVL